MVVNQLNWDKDNFENIEEAWKGDLWDRRCLGEQLTKYVDRLQCGAVLALDARWGEGKTWFVRHWAKHLDDTKHNVIYLDAFANDYLDDPFLVITSEIANILKKDKSTKRRVNKLIELSASVGTALLPSLPKVALTLGLHLVGAGLLSGVLQQGYESAKDEMDALSEEASDRIKESIQEKIAGHEAEKETLKEFKKHLAATVEKLEKPLVFIIDELDRCRPDFAIRLIERIKHFFDIPKIVFVLVMDKTQFSKVVCHNYGYDEKLGEEYLDKFVDFTVPLLPYNKFLDDITIIPIIKNLLSNVGEFSDDIVFIFYKYFNKNESPRNIKRIINLYALYKIGIVKKDIFLIISILNGTKDLFQQFENLLSDTTKFLENMDLTRQDLVHYYNSVLDLDSQCFVEIYYNLNEIKNTTYAFDAGDTHKRNLMLDIYSECAIKKISSLQNLSTQFEDYLNGYLI